MHLTHSWSQTSFVLRQQSNGHLTVSGTGALLRSQLLSYHVSPPSSNTGTQNHRIPFGDHSHVVGIEPSDGFARRET